MEKKIENQSVRLMEYCINKIHEIEDITTWAKDPIRRGPTGKALVSHFVGDKGIFSTT